MLTRRVRGRLFLLRPSKRTNPIVEYVLAVVSARYNICVHAVCTLSNHWHVPLTDPDGNSVEFQRDCHQFIARALNASHGEFESVWANTQGSRVECEQPGDLVKKIAYTMTNPVEARLVRHGHSWPGLRRAWPAPPRVVKKPTRFFRGEDEGGTWPDEAVLEMSRPPGHDHLCDEDLATLIDDAIEQREQSCRDKWRRIPAAQKPSVVRRCHPHRRISNPSTQLLPTRPSLRALRALSRFEADSQAQTPPLQTGGGKLRSSRSTGLGDQMLALCTRSFTMVVVLALPLACGSSPDSSGADSGPGGGGDGSGSDGGIDDGCPAYQTECNGECVITAVDPLNCGGCGVECTGNTACSAGACKDSCLGGLDICDNRCVDVSSDDDHCGACGEACPGDQVCVDSSCQAGISVGPDPAMCEGGGPPLDIPDPDGDRCAGDIAETTFRWALCSCRDVVIANPMMTDAFSSTAGSYEPGGLGGGIGLNGNYDAASEVDTYGDLWASAAGGLSSTNPTTVGLELHVGGTVTSSGLFSVDEHAFVAGDLNASDTFTIAGELHIPSGSTISEQVTYGTLINEPVAVGPPCDCEDDQLLPISAIVTAAATDNDNAAIGLNPDVLDNPDGNTRLDLPCGSYYLSSIHATSPMVVWAHGRTALYVGEDIVNNSSLIIGLDPDAELNLFVSGTITSNNPLTIGSFLYPALTRVYVAGASEITLTNPTDIGGFFYAAFGLLNVQNPLEVFGGVIAGDYNADNSVDIHYDREVLNAGDDCPEDPGGGCTSCLDCGNQACIDGTCGECTSNDQCCAPLQCVMGQCRLPDIE